MVGETEHMISLLLFFFFL